MKTAIETGMEWLMNHKPEVAFFIIIIVCTVAVTGTVYNFTHRVEKVENRIERLEIRVEDMQSEMDDRFKAVEGRFDKIDQRLDKIDAELIDIKIFMKKIALTCQPLHPNTKASKHPHTN